MNQLIPGSGQVNVKELCAQAAHLVDRVAAARERIREERPHYKVDLDARLTCFARFQNVIGSFQLSCAFWMNQLLSPQWWKQTTSVPESDWPHYRMEFQAFIKLGLVQLSYSTVESSFRIFMRALDPQAHAGAASSFKPIYEDLLMRRLSTPLPDFVELLDMASKVRHTVHNNGVYFHRSGQDADQSYKGRLYIFEYGKPVEFTSWPLILEIISDLIDTLSRVVRDPVVAGISTDIPDPIA